MTINNHTYTHYKSPLGAILIAGDAEHLHLISFPHGNKARQPQEHWNRDDDFFPETFAQFDAYFAGKLTRFDLPLHFSGTPFQNSVWTALKNIPYGKTTTYSAIANAIGRPTATRAVGAANGANPLPIVIPCHRVIGANNALTGFGGGIEAKKYLLEHEGVTVEQPTLL